jgi:hypothetical protein
MANNPAAPEREQQAPFFAAKAAIAAQAAIAAPVVIIATRSLSLPTVRR